MKHFLVLQNTYQCVEVGVFNGRHLQNYEQENKAQASKILVPLINHTLQRAKLNLTHLSFIAANRGPGPFTTLRTIIATANGLGFASNLPLIGVDGFNAYLQEYQSQKATYTVVLFNAFNKDVYFAIAQNGILQEKGYKKINQLLNNLQTKCTPNKIIQFFGNGAFQHKESILHALGEQAIISEDAPAYCSLEQVGQTALHTWKTETTFSSQLHPLYLKKQVHDIVS